MGSTRIHPRIRVNIKAELAVQGFEDITNGNITNISCGGCRIVLNQFSRVPLGTINSLTFALQDVGFVNEIQSTVIRVDLIDGGLATTWGCVFIGPTSETEKVAMFCHICSLSALS